MRSRGDLLELACRRIADLDYPAYVKNSELRYVAVNQAYADFFSKEISDFIGRRSRELFDRPEEEDREDKERRALVFASEESAICFDASGVDYHRTRIESFMLSPERVYVLGLFETERRAKHARRATVGPSIDRAAELDLLRAIMEALPVAAFARDDDHRLIYANPCFEVFTGQSRADALGKTEQEMFGDVAGGVIHRGNLEVLETGETAEVESLLPGAGGKLYPVLARINRIESTGGKRYVVGSFADVSLLKEREKELIAAQAHTEVLHRDIASILNSLPVGVLILESDLTILYGNQAFYTISDLPDRRFEGRPYRELVEHNHALGRYGPGVTPEEMYERRVRQFRSDDQAPSAEINWGSTSLVVDSRRISNERVLLTYADISTIRLHEKEIHAAREALESLGELMGDATHAMSQGLLIVQGDEILLSNDALAGMFDIPRSHLEIGRNWAEFFTFCAARGDFAGDPGVVLGELRQSLGMGQAVSRLFRVPEGRWVQMDIAVSERRHWVALFTDITAMKSREEELTLLLARAEAADKVKSEFLANMSHEIRTPMNGVLGMAELLANTNLDTRQKTFVDIIEKSGNALMTIINDILDFSKIDSGRMTLRRMTFDPVEAVEDVVTLLSSLAAERGVELLVRTASGLPSAIIGDAGRFRQILTNLVGNAIKFTERGHVLVDMDHTAGAADEIMATIRIEDTGIGMPPDRIDSIFGKFSQIDGSSTRRHEGTGLGLAITAGLVDLFGGYIEVESELGRGSVFTVNLPFFVAAARHDPRPLPINVRGARILVVDDNAVNRQILTEQLALWGFDGAAADDGIEGLAILESAHELGIAVDAIVLDYQIPGMNGADIARKLRADDRFSDLPIIFMTSMDIAGTEKEFAALNGQAHLMKPARANVLRNTIVDVVRTHRVRLAADCGGRSIVETEPEPAAASPVERPGPTFIDVLVAEDNDVNQIVFTQILQATGLTFLVVGNGQEAIEAWEKHTPRIIMMDVSMPLMNGHEATRSIRDIERGQGHRVPIVGVTAHALESDRELCLDAGMDDYISKPISPELLEEKIGLWLGKSERAAGRSAG
ncbi:histidine kinase [Rhizobium sp. Root1203]|uniref:PAS domain-containing hybrid sensor histidine kinase/response regulator n=1 Tax=Rhizobium sp. Root1203 TaxID=1736427 RepID=UPI000711122F|nr:response regulator [Rhizobium sp. Root1203]KQV30629.1 histidine kinase [Rhizobium sp. Root1203]